jgi:uncharacterized protein Veg
MIKNTVSVVKAKELINKLNTKRVFVTVNLGRNKTIKFSGVLSGVYHALFTITPDDEKFTGRTTYSYSEILCGRVKLSAKEKTV